MFYSLEDNEKLPFEIWKRWDSFVDERMYDKRQQFEEETMIIIIIDYAWL